MQGFLEFGVSFDSCITPTLTLLFSIATSSSVSLLRIPFALSCRTFNMLSSLFWYVGGVGVGGGNGVGGGVEQGLHAQSLLLRYWAAFKSPEHFTNPWVTVWCVCGYSFWSCMIFQRMCVLCLWSQCASKCIKIIQRTGMCELGALYHVCRGFFYFFHKLMWCLLCRTSTFSFVHCCKYTLCAYGWDISMWSMGYRNSSWRLMMYMYNLLRSLFRYSLHLIILAGKLAGCTLDRKKCLDFRHMATGLWQNREWVSLVGCFCVSTLSQTFLLIAGGTIPNIKYKSSTLVGFRHHVADRHAWFCSESRFLAWADLAQTGAAYLAVE